MRAALLAIAALSAAPTVANDVAPPIIDMHLHVRAAGYIGGDPPPMCTPFEIMPRSDNKVGVYEGLTFHRQPCAKPIPAAKTDTQVMNDTIAQMRKHNIVGVLSGEPNGVAKWTAAAPGLFIPAVDYRLPGTPGARHVGVRTIDDLRKLHAQGRLRVIGEIMAQYEGVAPTDPRMAPLWALAEELDIPVAIHMGEGEPGEPFSGNGYRIALGDPLLLEEVLLRHPKLRVSVMHAGYPLVERMRALLFSYPHVYVDIGGIVYTEPNFYGFLKELVDAGYGDRIMFGSDQMIWPGVIGESVRIIQEAPFLSAEQKRDIFYNNAARFLRLTPEEMSKHRR